MRSLTDNMLFSLCVLCFISFIRCQPTISVKSRSQRYSQVVTYLTNLGYLPTYQEDNAVNYQPLLPAAIRRFQYMANLPITDDLDEMTIEMMNRPRCGVKDALSLGRRSKRFVNQNTKWQNNLVSWRVGRFSSRLSHAQVLNVLRHAFGVWSAVANLYFEYRSTGPVDIEVKFTTGTHGDSYTFDGTGGILAHAFFPPEKGKDDTLAGDVHFDDQEPWTVNIHSDGQHLLPAAIHEIGHSLGLQHSNAVGSVMWPWTRAVGNEQQPHTLDYDDVSAIQTLYGRKKSRFQRDQSSHYLCQQPVDAILRAVDGKIYMFNGQAVRQLDPSTLTQIGQPSNIRDIFAGIPASTVIDGAVTYQGSVWSKKKSYLFVGGRYYRYSYKNHALHADNGYPKTISYGWNLDTTSFDSVFTSKNHVMLVFTKGNQYWHHTGTSLGAYDGYPKNFINNTVFSQITGTINAGLLLPNGTNYFFTNDEVYRVSYHGGRGHTIDSMC